MNQKNIIRLSKFSNESEKKEKSDEENSSKMTKINLEEEKILSPMHNSKSSHYYRKRSTHHMLPKIFTIGESQENANSQYIYSWSKYHPLSFHTGSVKFGIKNYRLPVPSPSFIETKLLQVKPDLTKKGVLEGMVVDDISGLVLVDKNIGKKFKGIISNMIKQILGAALTGKPISLPVRLFEPKSTLQRITDYWSFAPVFLKKASETMDPLERMKLTMSFAISGLYVPTKQLKPFNPLIGETFQGKFDGTDCNIYVEHISHYPTVCRFLMNDKEYKIHGYFDFTTQTASFGNKISIMQRGPINIEFPKTKDKITYNMPTVNLLNARSEEGRSAIWVDCMVFVDVVNNLKGVIQFANNSKYIHGFNGVIMEYKYMDNYKFDVAKEIKEGNQLKLPMDMKKVKGKIYSQINGSWLKELKFDDRKYWDIDSFTPAWIRPLTNVLPSDWRFREDLIWLFRSFNATSEAERETYEDYSQNWKILTEQIQRGEREIRKKLKSHHKK
jgi:hypothetical protein